MQEQLNGKASNPLPAGTSSGNERHMEDIYSVRMRSAQGGDHVLGGRHISGAERLVPRGEIAETAAAMVKRAQGHERGEADFINIVVEKIDKKMIMYQSALPVTTVHTENYREGRCLACRLLCRIGLEPAAAEQAVKLLAEPGQQMRGAMVIDIRTGLRIDEKAQRGIRVSRMDAAYHARDEFARRLAQAGLPAEHTREALILATKVCAAPGMEAELCWSDDPGYTAGYVASKKYGYIRFPHLKPQGLAQGGRAFFFNPQAGDYAELVRYLEKQPVFIEPVQRVTPPQSWEEFLKGER